MLEDLRRNVVGQNTQEDGFVFGTQVEKNLGNISWRKVTKNGSELGKVTFRDQIDQFGLQQIANHAPNQTQVSRASKTKLRPVSDIFGSLQFMARKKWARVCDPQRWTFE
jgi:hypothetical protein